MATILVRTPDGRLYFRVEDDRDDPRDSGLRIGGDGTLGFEGQLTLRQLAPPYTIEVVKGVEAKPVRDPRAPQPVAVSIENADGEIGRNRCCIPDRRVVSFEIDGSGRYLGYRGPLTVRVFAECADDCGFPVRMRFKRPDGALLYELVFDPRAGAVVSTGADGGVFLEGRVFLPPYEIEIGPA